MARKYSGKALQDLKDMQANDPDGWSIEPKPDHYIAFEADSIRRYGKALWNIYRSGAWTE